MRHRHHQLAPAATALLAALALAACGSTAGTGTVAGSGGSPAAAAADAVPSQPGQGAYISQAEYEKDPAAFADSTVVLFFHAPWCPSCRATEQAIRKTGVPAGLTLVKVDFDTQTALRKTYGVTQQHTFVQVDGTGAELAKWTGSPDGAAILAKTV